MLQKLKGIKGHNKKAKGQQKIQSLQLSNRRIIKKKVNLGYKSVG